MPEGSSVCLRGPQRRRERFRTLTVVIAAVITSDRVMMGDRAAGTDDGVARRGL